MQSSWSDERGSQVREECAFLVPAVHIPELCLEYVVPWRVKALEDV